MPELTHHQTFGADQDPTIYFMCGYSSTLGQYRAPIGRILVNAGFRVMAFDYDNRVLNSGDPQDLPHAVDEVVHVVEEDKRNREVAGTYGVSLGSLVALNVLRLDGVPRAMFNTGGVKASNAVWQARRLKTERANFEKNGRTKEDLAAAWAPYEDVLDASGMAGKKLLIMDSTADQTIDYREAVQTFQTLWQQGVDVSFLTLRGLSHKQANIWNLLARPRLTRRFFRGEI